MRGGAAMSPREHSGTGNRSGEGELDVAGLDAHAAVGLERGEGVDEGGVAQAAGVAELAAGQGGRGVIEGPRVAGSARGRAQRAEGSNLGIEGAAYVAPVRTLVC